MQRFTYDIDAYTLSVELKHLDSPTMGYVSLWNGTTRVADFRIMKEGKSLNPIKFSEDDVLTGDISDINRNAIVDILRNEGPLKLMAWYDGTRFFGLRISTASGSLEPVGEGE